MRPFRSCQNQCCCCVVAILLPLGSVILTGIGVCVILKYVMIRTDLLLPELQNHDGQKIVGIILTSVGVLGIIISAIVAILYFTVCHESRSGQPAVAQKICKNGIEENSNSPATPKMQANGHLTPKSPAKRQPSTPKSLFSSERMDSAKPISTIGVPPTSTPRRTRGGKNGRPLSSNLDIVEEVDGDVPVPMLQLNGRDLNLSNSCKRTDTVFHNGQNGIVPRPILKSSSTTTTTTTNTNTTAANIITATTTTTTTNTVLTSNNIASTNSIAAAPAAATATSNTKSVSRSLFSTGNIPDSSTDNNHNNNNNNNNNTTTARTSTSSSSHTSSVHSKPYHDSTNTTTTTAAAAAAATITDLDHSNCDSDQDTQTQDSDCEITSSRL